MDLVANSGLFFFQDVDQEEEKARKPMSETDLAQMPGLVPESFRFSCSDKSCGYVAIDEAMQDAAEGRTIPVPMHIKDGNVRKATQISVSGKAGDAYRYTHADGIADPHLGVIGAQDYLGVEKQYYRPRTHGSEKVLKDALERARAARGPKDVEA